MSETALRDLIRLYTREAGVRNLEREIAHLVRKAVKEIAVGDSKAVKLDRRNLDKYAGVPRYRYGEAELEDMVGVSTGLAGPRWAARCSPSRLSCCPARAR